MARREKRKGNMKDDKNIIHLPRHSSFTIIHTFANFGKTGHNMAESLANTTV
jgi:hypothetical protein